MEAAAAVVKAITDEYALHPATVPLYLTLR